jgi:hypothetical protein
LIQDPGFEQQTSQYISWPWEAEPDDFGILVVQGTPSAAEGSNFIQIQGIGWHAIKQRVSLDPTGRYRLEGWVKSTPDVLDGYFGVRYPSYGRPDINIVKETIFGAGPWEEWKWLSVDFDAGGYAGDAYTVYVGVLEHGYISVDHLTLRLIEPAMNLVDDSGFENQTKSSVISPPWFAEGAGLKGVYNQMSGKNAFLRATSGWNAITQKIAANPSTQYTAQARIKTSPNVTDGYFGVRDGNGMVVTEVKFGPLSDGDPPRVFSFQGAMRYLGYDPMMTLFVGFWAPGQDAWIEIDDIGVFEGSQVRLGPVGHPEV